MRNQLLALLLAVCLLLWGCGKPQRAAEVLPEPVTEATAGEAAQSAPTQAPAKPAATETAPQLSEETEEATEAPSQGPEATDPPVQVTVPATTQPAETVPTQPPQTVPTQPLEEGALGENETPIL